MLIVRPKPGKPTRGILRVGPLALPCALGRSGRTAFKREGDGATPIGSFAVLNLYKRGDRPLRAVRSLLPTRRTRLSDGWCDAPGDPAYNRPVRLPHRASAETMWREDRLYDAVVVLDYNVQPRARNRGSAIFLHVAKPGFPPTEGCIALAPRDMARVLPHLRRGRRIVVL